MQVAYPNGYEMGALCLASMVDNYGGGFYGFPLDNHSLTLDMCKDDGYTLKRIGTIFYQLDHCEEPEPIWNKALTFNNTLLSEEDLHNRLVMARYTPNFYKEVWKYLGYEILGIDEFDAADKKRVRLIRHKDNRKVKVIDGKEYANSLYDIYLHDNDVFMAYQSE